MSGSYVSGTGRRQLSFLPDMIEDYVGEDNPARFIDTFVDSIDLHDLGFKYSVLGNGAGRPSYDPQDMLKIHLWAITMPYVLQGNLTRSWTAWTSQ